MISINPSTYVIAIPQADLTPMGGTSYQLDTNAFRIALKDWEDSVDGIYQPKTHNHNTTVSIGGVQYARLLEILSPYTITFQDVGSPYKVFLIGSNNNIFDKVNLNNVSVAPNNSAGLINVVEVQHGVFGDGVTIDVINGTAGTIYPKGSKIAPVNNLADALVIAVGRGFSQIFIKGDLTLGATDNVAGYTLIGAITIDASNVAGSIYIAGSGWITNNAGAGCTVICNGRTIPNDGVTYAMTTGALSIDQDTKLADIHGAMPRQAGLMMENHVEDDIVRNATGLKTSSVIYLYDSKTNALAHDGATGLIETYSVAIAYDGSNKTSLFKVVRN